MAEVSMEGRRRYQPSQSGKKLLILDLNGLLADIVTPPPKDHKPDICMNRRAIFARPSCRDFLRFCFERFEVGVWSSRNRKNVDNAISYLMGDMKHNLLFSWDQSHCTETPFRCPENRHKPILFKELRKLWEKEDPTLPWEKGYYNETNTILLDDSPYKALLNPPYTSVFPLPYTYQNTNDFALGEGGDLRIYLHYLAAAHNVQEFVANYPFGQQAITQQSESWDFYLQVIHSLHDNHRNSMTTSCSTRVVN